MIPRQIFLTKGVGRHKEKLQSFEWALRKAGIAPYNLVRVSSIFPPGCKMISKEKGLTLLKPGEIVFGVFSENATNEPNRLIACSIGVAIPSKPENYGYLSEHHSFGQTDEIAGSYAEDLAATMLATTLGLDFDLDRAWDERKQEYKMSGRFVRTQSVVQTARGEKNGLWTTTIAAAVFIEH